MECVQPAAFVPEAPCNGPNTEGCSDNLSIMRTVESLLATAVNRCVGRICNLAGTRAPRPVREGNQRLRHSPMLQNSKYSVWFRTSKGDGYGIVSLMDGKVSGGDNISSYTGTYVQDGDKFAATVAVRRHTQGPASVFGVDNVDLTLSGKSTPTMASCIGTAKQAPSTTLQATLIRIAD
jgi:hypothetical protein